MRALALALLLAGCGDDACPPAAPVTDQELVAGVSVQGLAHRLTSTPPTLPLAWADGRETRLSGDLMALHGTGTEVQVCEACPEPCGQTWLLAHAAAVLETDDGALVGEPMAGRVRAMDERWRLDLSMAHGADLRGTLDPWTVVPRPDDVTDWSLNVVLVGEEEPTGAALLAIVERARDGERWREEIVLAATP